MAQGVGGGLPSLNSSSVTCSICLDDVTVNSGRSMARLQCGHHFHLDCIGSEFNVRGAMQCPNCREIENGEWLFANRGPERSINHETEDYDVQHYIRMMFQPPSGLLHWYVFQGLQFQVMGLPSPGYQETIQRRVIFPRGPNYNHHWNGPPVPSEISASHALHANDRHYRNSNNHFVFTPMTDHISGANQASVQSATPRFAQGESDSIPSPESFTHPVILDHRSGAGTLGSVNVPAHDRFQVRRQQPISNSPSPVVRASMLSGIRGSNHSRGLVLTRAAASSPDQTDDFYPVLSLGLPGQNLREAANPLLVRDHAWESDGIAPSERLPGDRDSFFRAV